MKKVAYWKLIFIFILLGSAITILLTKKIKLGLDLLGGMHLVLGVEEEKLPKDTKVSQAIDSIVEILRTRVDEFGVAEPLIQKQGEDKVIVQLPGIKDPERAKKIIGKTALLEFRLVDEDRLSEALDGKVPEGWEILYGDKEIGETPFLVKKTPEITGKYLTDAWVTYSQVGGIAMPLVNLKFNSEGAKKFKRITQRYLEKRLAIVLDNVVKSAPTIKDVIPDGRAVIDGIVSQEEAYDLSIVLRAGALPCPIRIEEDRTVGPSLGKDSIKAGIIAAIIGFLAIVIFMSIYYKFSGLIANFGLISNVIMVLGILSLLDGTLTLPGIAGIILTVGISVDANILIFERIREELRAGKTVKAAINSGYQKAFLTILDSHLTVLLTSIILFILGAGPIRGFAVTLILGILMSLVSAVFITKAIFDTKKTYKTLSI
jgi:protein-export membrane protein SecD